MCITDPGLYIQTHFVTLVINEELRENEQKKYINTIIITDTQVVCTWANMAQTAKCESLDY